MILVLMHPPLKNIDKSNLYLSPLYSLNNDKILVKPFRWREALFSKYEIFHVHWIEHLVSSKNYIKSTLKSILSIILFARLFFFRIPIVLTQHNFKPHYPIKNAFSKLIFSLWCKNIKNLVVMNNFETSKHNKKVFHIPHHLYSVEDFSNQSLSNLPTKINPYFLVFGRIELNRKILEISELFLQKFPNYYLYLVGEISNRSYSKKLFDLQNCYHNIKILPYKISKSDLDNLIFNSLGVIGPFNEYLNSGVIFHSLSLGKPVLTAANETSEELEGEFSNRFISRAYKIGFIELEMFIKNCVYVSKFNLKPNLTPDRSISDFCQKHINMYHHILRNKN